MNYTSNVFSNENRELTLGHEFSLNEQSLRDEDEQLREFKAKLGLSDTIVLDLPHTKTENQQDDILPSRTTMEGKFVREYTPASTSEAKAKLTAKQKIAVASYIAVVLVLVLTVTLCGVSISGSFASVMGLVATSSQLGEQLEQVNELIAEDNYQQLYDKALEQGFVPGNAENSYTYSALETRPAQNFAVESNWFDALCDWLSGVFGGN